MTATSAQDRARFTPASYEGADGAPVYVIAPLTFRDRGRFRAAIAGEGIRYPQDREVAQAALDALGELRPENADALSTKIQDFLELLDGPKVGEPPAADAPAEEQEAFAADLARRFAVAKPYDEVLDVLRQHPRIAHLFSLRVLFAELAGPIAASFGLVGWENVSGTFRRSNGTVPDHVLDLLPDDDLKAIGGQVLLAMSLSQAQRGNSASPSPSAGGQETSTAS